MAETSRDERTQRATAKRRTDEKRKGNVPMSREVQSLVTLVCVVGVIWALGGVVIGGLKEIMDFTFRSMASREFSLATVTRVMGRVGMLTTIVVGPLLDDRGRPYAGRDGPAIVELRVGGEEAPWKRLIGTLGAPKIVAPGPVAVRARVQGANLTAENKGTVQSGGTLRLELHFRAP